MGCASSVGRAAPAVEGKGAAPPATAPAVMAGSVPIERAKLAADGPYLIVDEHDLASDAIDRKTKEVKRNGLVPIAAGDEAEMYWQAKTVGRKSKAERGSEPVLVIMYGTPGCGKSRALKAVVEQLGWIEGDYVHLDPDECRLYSREYRLCLSGAHAALLPEVKERFGDSLRPAVWRSPVGGFTEEGFTVDVGGVPHFPALAMAALRSQDIVRSKMLYGPKVVEMTDALVDRALCAGYNIVYDTMGNEPNKFLRGLMRRARSQHAYRIVVCGCYAPWPMIEKRITARATKEGRHAAIDFVKMNHNGAYAHARARGESHEQATCLYRAHTRDACGVSRLARGSRVVGIPRSLSSSRRPAHSHLPTRPVRAG